MAALRRLLILMASLWFCWSTVPCYAQILRPGPIRIVVPFAAGGAADTIARLLVEEFQNVLGQPTIVENRPGANGVSGVTQVTQATPTGNTLVLLTSAIGLQNLRKDLEPIGMIAKSPFVLAASKAAPYASAKELLDQVRQGKVRFGVDRSSSLALAQFQKATGSKIPSVGFAGGQPAITALASGQIDAAFVAPSAALSVREQVKLLGISSASRFPSLPDVPTLKEQGIDNAVFEAWAGLAAPRGTPDQVISILSGALLAAAKKPEFIARLQMLGYRSTPTGPKEFFSSANEAGGVPTCGDPCPSECGSSGCDSVGCCVVSN